MSTIDAQRAAHYAARQAAYRAANRDKINAQQARYRAKKRGERPPGSVHCVVCDAELRDPVPSGTCGLCIEEAAL